MAIVEPLKPPRTNDPKELRKFLEALALSTSYLTASGDPTGSVAPRWYGDRYYDAVAKAWYWAAGLTSADWATVDVSIDPAADIADFGITASKLWLSVPVVLGLTLTSNSPVAGSVAWSEFDLYLNGVKYDVPAGNTANKYIYFKDLSATMATSNTNPSELADWAPQEDFVIAVNISGTGQQAWSGIANQVIGNAFIESLSGVKIQATSSVAIGNTTFGQDGIQLQYNSGDPRFYAGNGSTKFLKFDGTDVEISGKLTIGTSSSGYSNLSDKPTLGDLAAKSTAGASDLDSTVISGGKIITGLLTADNISAGTLSVDRLSAGSITYGKLSTGASDRISNAGNASGSSTVSITRVSYDYVFCFAWGRFANTGENTSTASLQIQKDSSDVGGGTANDYILSGSEVTLFTAYVDTSSQTGSKSYGTRISTGTGVSCTAREIVVLQVRV